MSNLYALLIGVDFYFPNRLEGGVTYRHLGGCVRDVTHVEAFLRGQLGLTNAQIIKLSAANTGGPQPPEPAGQWPTYANMVAAFNRITTLAQPGDRVYVHYAGHGGRAKSAYPGLKSSGLDEGLVPTDIGQPGSQYLRDVELNYLIQGLIDKGILLTVVLDSCHSGGATRGSEGPVLGAVARGSDKVDRADRSTPSLVAPLEQLIARYQGDRTTARGVKSASGWLLEPKGYTLLAACRDNELAYEFPFNGRESNGALTYWLLDTLRTAGGTLTYKMLHDRILAKVHSRFAEQTPVLQGEGDIAVFGSERIKPRYAVPVLNVELASRRVQINAGEVHGISVGTQFGIYRDANSNFDQPSERIAIVEAQTVGAVDAWTTIIEPQATVTIEEGMQAVLLSAANVRLQRNILLDIADDTVRTQVESAIARDGKGFIKVAGRNDVVDFALELTADGELQIQDAADQPLPRLRPAIKVGDADAVNRTVGRLIHLARFANVRDLDMPDATMQQKLSVTLEGKSEHKPGERATLVIQNRQAAGAANDASRILNITVLDLASNWSITQVYPARAGAFAVLNPGETIRLELEAFLTEGQTESVDILKVFATRATTQFHWLQLPALDQPLGRGALRSAVRDPLERMLASITGEEATSRDIRIVNAPEDPGWTVEQVELRVKA
jgi:hypothetical protein